MQQTHAEWLIELAERVIYPKNRVLCENSGVTNDETNLAVSRIALALRFYNMPAEVKLKAIVEEWEPIRIVREVY